MAWRGPWFWEVRGEIHIQVHVVMATRSAQTPAGPAARGWLIRHPRYPNGFKHFLLTNELATREMLLILPELSFTPIPISVAQTRLDDGPGDCTGRVMWRAAQVLSLFLVYHRFNIKQHAKTQTPTVVEIGCGATAVP